MNSSLTNLLVGRTFRVRASSTGCLNLELKQKQKWNSLAWHHIDQRRTEFLEYRGSPSVQLFNNDTNSFRYSLSTYILSENTINNTKKNRFDIKSHCQMSSISQTSFRHTLTKSGASGSHSTTAAIPSISRRSFVEWHFELGANGLSVTISEVKPTNHRKASREKCISNGKKNR